MFMQNQSNHGNMHGHQDISSEFPFLLYKKVKRSLICGAFVSYTVYSSVPNWKVIQT